MTVPLASRVRQAHSAHAGETTEDSLDTRTTLIERLQDGRSQAAWQEFFDIYTKLIHSFACKRGLSSCEAQDVVQETMIAVFKRLPGFQYDRQTGSFRAWLLTISHWRVLDRLRQRRRFAPLPATSGDTIIEAEEVGAFLDPAWFQFEALWELEWKKGLMDAAISTVKRKADPKKYQIFDFCVIKGWEPAKVAAAFKISVGQVYLAKHRITELLKNEIKRLQEDLRWSESLEAVAPKILKDSIRLGKLLRRQGAKDQGITSELPPERALGEAHVTR